MFPVPAPEILMLEPSFNFNSVLSALLYSTILFRACKYGAYLRWGVSVLSTVCSISFQRIVLEASSKLSSGFMSI